LDFTDGFAGPSGASNDVLLGGAGGQLDEDALADAVAQLGRTPLQGSELGDIAGELVHHGQHANRVGQPYCNANGVGVPSGGMSAREPSIAIASNVVEAGGTPLAVTVVQFPDGGVADVTIHVRGEELQVSVDQSVAHATTITIDDHDVYSTAVSEQEETMQW
jgi:hypothetical protein